MWHEPQVKHTIAILCTLLLSGCFLGDGWTQRLPTEIDYEARHIKTLENRTEQDTK